jgi:hypothetical protein
MGKMKNVHTILVAKPEGKSYSEDLGADDRIILKRVLRKLRESVWTGFIWLRIGIDGGPL